MAAAQPIALKRLRLERELDQKLKWVKKPALAIALAFLGLNSVQVDEVRAFSLFGVCFSGDCENDQDDGPGFIDPRNYDVEFDVQGAPEELAESLKASSELWRGKDSPVAGSAGLAARAKGDYRRILAALYNKGYYAGEISIVVNGRQASDLQPGQDLPENSSVTIRVGPGSTYLFSRTEIINAAPPTLDRKDQSKTPEEVGFAPGKVAEAGAVRLAGAAAREAWRQQGHPLARIGEQDVTAVHPQRQLNVSIRMAPGPRADIGDISVEGTERMDPAFVAYMTGLIPGQEYDPDDLEKARKRLDRLGVFSTRKIEEAKAVSANGLLPLNVIVSERKLRRIGVGATLSSVDGAGIEAYWLHRNLFGRAEKLRLDAQIGGIGGAGGTFSPGEYDYLLGATFTQPGYFTPDTDLVWNILAKREFNETYEETAAGLSVGLTNYWSDEITFTAGAFAQFGEFTDIFGTRTFLTTGLQGDVVYDNRDNKLDAKRGLYARFDAKPFYEWEFGGAAARLEAEARSYFAFDTEGRSVLAARVKVGSLVGSSLTQTPPNLLFTAGGGNSVRGFAFKSIGVENAVGDISGGRSLFEGSLEFRQRINESFGAVAFVDAGTVSEASFTDFSEDLKVGVGLGIRYYTGLGPIRVDVAIPLNPGPDDDGFAFYAGIGQAF